MIFLKGSISQIKYIRMEYSIGPNFPEDMEFSNYQIFEELHRTLFFYWHGVLHEVRFIKAYRVLKIITSIKPSIMQVSFFYNGVLHETIFINDSRVLKLIIIDELHVVVFFSKCMECSMPQHLLYDVELLEYFSFKELLRAFFCNDMEYLMR